MSQINTDLETLKTARDNMKTALEGKGQTVTKDIRTYANAIANIPTEGGGVKLFETEQAMQTDVTAEEGDLATVYNHTMAAYNGTSAVSGFVFPTTVTFDTAISQSYSLRGDYYGDNISISATGSLSATSMNLTIFSRGRKAISYTSSDGLTYTKSGAEDTLDFGEDCVIEWDNWNDVFSPFMLCESYYYGGLYQYVLNVPDEESMSFKPLNKLSFTYASNSISGVTYDSSEEATLTHYNLEKMMNIVKDIYSTESITGPNTTFILFMDESDDIHCAIFASTYRLDGIAYNPSKTKLGLYSSNTSTASPFSSLAKCYTIDYENDSYTQDTITTSTFYTSASNQREMITSPMIKSLGFFGTGNNYSGEMKVSSNLDHSMYIGVGTNPYTEGASNGSYKIGISGNAIDNKYLLAPSQLTTVSEDVYSGVFYGQNGIETGTLGDITNLSKTQIADRIVISSKLDTFTLPEDCRELFKRSDAADLDHINIQRLNTSNVTNMQYMFRDCSNLTSLDLSNFDTSSVVQMYGMFMNCSSLTTLDISSLDTRNVTDMQYLFYGCSNLTSLDLSNFDFRKVTTFQDTFSGCTSLTLLDLSSLDFNTLPKPDSTYAGYFSGMFSGVPTNCTIYVKNQDTINALRNRDNSHTYTIKP